MCSTEGITEEKERLQNETSEPERVKRQSTGARREQEKIQHNKKIEIVLSGEILRP